jgi:NTE family protein
VGLLSGLQTLSSVSGGSVVNGLLAKAWPDLAQQKDGNGSFTRFSELVEQPLREFCSHDIRTGPLLTERLDPRNWPSLWGDDHSATDLLAHTYQDKLVGRLRLKDLAARRDTYGVKFVFDTSNLQTGVNFTFSADGVGDWKLGHSPAPDVLLADAVAASSAFPVAFPPLVLKFDSAQFHGGELAADARYTDLSRRAVLSDGGVYDNLGLEPVWKSHQVVMCSDGGKPFDISTNPSQALPGRLLRVQDVIGNQALAVRKRWLISSYEAGVYEGTYWGVGTEIENYASRGPGYDAVALDRIRRIRTDFDAFSEAEQLILMNHGWALAGAALCSHMPTYLPKPVPPGSVPSQELLGDQQRVLDALKDSDKTRVLGH